MLALAESLDRRDAAAKCIQRCARRNVLPPKPAAHEAADDERPCAICLNAIAEEGQVLSGCSHRFHTSCINTMVSYHMKPVMNNSNVTNACIIKAVRACRCPTCLAPMGEDEISNSLAASTRVLNSTPRWRGPD